jgi:NMD protein affecting ribosome stability and mRNA decay
MSEFLESCHVCGHDIASEAELCRNCGAKASPTERLRQQAALLAELDREHNERMKREKEQESF